MQFTSSDGWVFRAAFHSLEDSTFCLMIREESISPRCLQPGSRCRKRVWIYDLSVCKRRIWETWKQSRSSYRFSFVCYYNFVTAWFRYTTICVGDVPIHAVVYGSQPSLYSQFLCQHAHLSRPSLYTQFLCQHAYLSGPSPYSILLSRYLRLSPRLLVPI